MADKQNFVHATVSLQYVA